jgi:O-antigen/teichoic acid export membrane protein
MLLNMAITFYTSRVVLNTLGVEDFGIYGVVGGIIAMFGFLNSSMAGATSRFLTFELGRQDFDKLKKTFSAALTVHFLIAVIILLLGETAGLWWLENKLVIAPERMNAARWVFHLSVIASVIGITQVPYNATIIAHERMNVYAYIEILNSLLKLAIVFLLVMGNFDKLILYAILTLCVTIIITTIYKIYCARNLPETHYKFQWNKEIIKPMISFSGWNLYLNSSFTLKTQGINMILNLFFGVVINAAYGIAGQVQNAATGFANNFLMAVRPQIVKYYAEGNIAKMQNLIINASKFSFFLLFLISFPLIIENKFILQIWLKNVSEYAVIFSQLFLVYFLISSSNSTVTTAIQATGKVKGLSIVDGTLFLLVIPISYLFLKAGYSPIVPMIVNIVLLIISVAINIFILKHLIPKFSLTEFILKFFMVSVLLLVLSSIVPVWLHFSLEEGFIRFCVVLLSFTIILCVFTYCFALNKIMKQKLRNIIYKQIKTLIK